MKTWQMIKELMENPKKRFAYATVNDGSYVTVKDSVVVWQGAGQSGQNLSMELDNTEWKEVKQPVSFMEAVASGKCMKIGSRDSYETLSRLLYILAAEYTDEFIAHVLTTGEFYTED